MKAISTMVLLCLTTGSALACESTVVRHPLLPNTTMVFSCDPIRVTGESTVAMTEAPLAPVIAPAPKNKVKKHRTKKRCWYTNKRGQKKYRLRYKC